MMRSKELLDEFTLEDHPMVSTPFTPQSLTPDNHPVADEIHDIRQGPRRRRLLFEFGRQGPLLS